MHPLTVSVGQAVPQLPELRFREPITWDIREDEHWAIVGPNGSGKTLLAAILQGRYLLKEGVVRFHMTGKASDLVKSIAFKDIHSIAGSRNAYYQQRWHATETEEWPTVGDLLAGMPNTSEDVSVRFCIHEFLSRKVIHLSSGEFRKFQIIRTLLSKPRILILDNPYIGLDAASRNILTEMLTQAAQMKRVQMILLLSDPTDIPTMITHVLPLCQRRLLSPQTRTAFLSDMALQAQLFPTVATPVQLPIRDAMPSTHKVTVRMERVSICYGDRTILKEIQWEVRNGEKWALYGPNGSGKTLLLSLIYADNPQAYARTLYLFDRRRGTGESIWDIKRRIGYVSPEMHLYYTENISAFAVVCSGFFDSVGLYGKCDETQKQAASAWMRLFGIDALKDRSFSTLSSGEQRLTLLARAFVKRPDLLVLDEPLHGLDASAKHRVTRIIEAFCAMQGKTLIYVTHYLHELPSCINRRFELCPSTTGESTGASVSS